MASTDYDIIVGGYKAKIAWDQQGAFRKRTLRREVEQGYLSQAQEPNLGSRMDQLRFYQTSWSDGAMWWKPLVGEGTLASYYRSNQLDLWSEPGKVVPLNSIDEDVASPIHDHCIMAAGAAGVVHAIGETTTTDAGMRDVYKWAPANNDFARYALVSSGVDDLANPVAMVYDPTDGYFYVVADDDDLERFDAVNDLSDADWITTGFTAYTGTSIFLQNQNLMLYDGEKLYTVTKGTPAVAQAFNDGMGPDFLNEADFAGTAPQFQDNLNLAVSTPEGVYYVKNTRQGDQPVAWVYRVDKDAAGTWIGNPIATLPKGSVALGIGEHLGNLVISATPDWRAAITNDTNSFEVNLYFVDEQGMGALGTVLGRGEVDETPYAILGSDGPHLYIGGQKRVWVYDAIRGGIHSRFEHTVLTDGVYSAMAFVEDSAGFSNLLFVGKDQFSLTRTEMEDAATTVATFGNDETTYTLESNYFDGGTPMELKEITKVAILRDPGDGGSEWTVQIAADDGGFSDALVHSTSGETHAVAELSGTTGYRFRYKLIYQTKDANDRIPLRAVMVTLTSGEMVTEWDMILTGEEILNVHNELQDEQAFYDNMVTLAGTQGVTTLVDNVQEQDQETDDATTQNIKVMAVEIIKDKPGESLVHLVVREE